MVRITILILATLFWRSGNFQETNTIKFLSMVYETNLNSSLILERDDKALRNSWMVKYQVQKINVTAKYRLQMTKHRENSFQRPALSDKWTECLFLQRRQIRKATKDYFANESECLTITSLGDADCTIAVEQLEKEIRKWRRGYRYLIKKCKTENPGDEEASEACLVKYMERDNYNQVIQRLIILKLEAMGKLYLHLTTSQTDLGECLKNQLSTYRANVEMIVETLDKCYDLKSGKND